MAFENIAAAKDTKNDEFYTQLADIQLELNNYSDKFKEKKVFCNCDDPFESNFVKYLAYTRLRVTIYGEQGINRPDCRAH